jgi:cyanophycinase
MTALDRRQLLALLGGMALPLVTAAQPRKPGHLVIIGGAEDRKQDRVILKKFLELSGGHNARIQVITAASETPAATWQSYQDAFKEIGATQCEWLPIATRADAFNATVVKQLSEAQGIFMTGGDQNILMQCLLGSPAARAMHRAFQLNGACIGGTSAGAAVMSYQMLALGSASPDPEKDIVSIHIGLGFVPHAIIDQHFSQRERLGRLLSALAERPDMLGVGIDEDTALIIEPNQSVEIVGRGAVTLIDPRHMRSNFNHIGEGDKLEMLGLQLHLLPAGKRYVLPNTPKSRQQPVSLWEALSRLTQPGSMRG